MKVTKTIVEKLLITEATRSEGCGTLDPISVILEDHGDGAGQITISCYGDSWNHYWSHMGKDNTLANFFCRCDTDYLVGKLKSGISYEIDDDDPDALENLLKREIIKERLRNNITKEEARGFYDEATDYDRNCDSVDFLYNILGEEWWYRTPKKPNPDYLYLSDIVKVVQQTLKDQN